MFDIQLCEDCGTKFDALQAVADAIGEELPLEVVVAELCSVCLPALREAVK